MRRAACLIAIAALLGCTTASPDHMYYGSGEGSVTPDGLHRVKWQPFRTSFVKPGARLGQYDKVMIDAVSVAYKRPPQRYSRDGNFALSETSLALLRELFHEAFTEKLTDGSFTLATAAGPNVLRISGHIVDLVVAVPNISTLDATTTIVTRSAGAATLVLDVRDSQSGEPLVRVGQRAPFDPGDATFHTNDPVANTAAVRRLFRKWAAMLTRELDQLHSLPKIPLPDGS
jgi:hypothetical protein